jgi:predicted SAM-dependent methyltransferase
MIKLHLGCGTRRLDGYINIDHPPSKHTVQRDLVADRYADIRELHFDAGTVDEVRLHHVFEHFPRQIALALLCRWTDWLRPGGILRIETPDVVGCARALVSPFISERGRQQIVRHLFGSHEAIWAVHWDGWYQERFRLTLSALGYKSLDFIKTRWEALRNIEVIAHRGNQVFGLEQYESIVSRLLEMSVITHKSWSSRFDVAQSERVMLSVWLEEWKAAYVEQGADS